MEAYLNDVSIRETKVSNHANHGEYETETCRTMQCLSW